MMDAIKNFVERAAAQGFKALAMNCFCTILLALFFVMMVRWGLLFYRLCSLLLGYLFGVDDTEDDSNWMCRMLRLVSGVVTICTVTLVILGGLALMYLVEGVGPFGFAVVLVVAIMADAAISSDFRSGSSGESSTDEIEDESDSADAESDETEPVAIEQDEETILE